jgi:DNA adenine methylase
MSEVRRPALRYHGGKWKLAPWIISHFPHHRIYVEPFGGAASVLLRKPRSYAEVYNDLDGEIVNLFRVLRNPAQARELVRLVKLTPYAREEFDLSYITDGDPIEQARRTLVRSAMGHGTRTTTESKTGFRSYTGNDRGAIPAIDWTNVPSALELIVQRMGGVVIENRPAIELIQHHDGVDSLLYCDPPYPSGVRNNYGSYRHEMTDQDHRQMAATLHAAQGMVIVSGYACPLYDDELFAEWHRVERATHADGARDRVEVLWISPRTWTALHQNVDHLPLFGSK